MGSDDGAKGREGKGAASLGTLLFLVCFVAPMLLVLFGLVFGPVFYHTVYLPCVECFDFEAAAARVHGLRVDADDRVPREEPAHRGDGGAAERRHLRQVRRRLGARRHRRQVQDGGQGHRGVNRTRRA